MIDKTSSGMYSMAEIGRTRAICRVFFKHSSLVHGAHAEDGYGDFVLRRCSMSIQKHVKLSLIFFVFFFPIRPANADQKSVYAITNHSTSNTNAYLIDPNGTISFQASVEGSIWIDERATGLCVWSEVERLFATYEDGPTISWASTKTLTREPDDEIDAPETSLAGIVADETNDVLYVVTRSNGHLYTYTYDEFEDTLILVHPNDPEYPNRTYRQLEGLESGNTLGLALDDDTGLLYVANGTPTVRYYNTETWELEDSITMDYSSVGIYIDGEGYLYAGGYMYQPHNYLLRYDLDGNPNDPSTSENKDMGYIITDIAVDRDTGILYTTTRRDINGRIGAVEVYDPTYWYSTDANDFIIDVESDLTFSGPAGIGIGSRYKPPHGMYINKVDDVNEITECVSLGDTYQYDIVFRPGPYDESNVIITDSLPEGVDFVSADPNDGAYYPRPEHKYVWDLGDVSANDPNKYFTLEVKVNQWSEPSGTLDNLIAAESESSYVEYEEYTPVCCWDTGNIIYVDIDAVYQSGWIGELFWQKGLNTGTSWENAYRDLQNALARARKGCGSEIWVAEGTYRPSNSDVGISFDMVPDVGIYGGFNATETQRNQRNWKMYDSILSGYILEQRSNKIVRGSGYLGNAVLDGFTIKDGIVGIYCEDTWDLNDLCEPVFANCTITNNNDEGMQFYDYADATVSNCEVIGNIGNGIDLDDNCWPVINNCTIGDNNGEGISCTNSVFFVTGTQIIDNNGDGVYLYGSDPTITHCVIEENAGIGINSDAYSNCFASMNLIRLNGESGISCNSYSLANEIYNNWIYHNGLDGINCYDTTSYAVVRNNTIVYNDGYGVACDAGRQPIVTNSIVWGNLSGDVYNCSPTYSCFDNGTSGTDNIAVDPNFAHCNPDLYNYHLSEGSSCIDAGDNTDVEPDETDIDGQNRIYEDYIVDMGADEFTCSDICNALDLNGDGIINLTEYHLFSQSWLSHDPDEPGLGDPNDAENWNSECNFNDTGDSQYVIDVNDLAVFANNWLWRACWLDGGAWEMMGRGSGGCEGMMMSMPMTEFLEPETLVKEPKSIEQQILDLEEIIKFLEEIWLEDTYIQEEIDPDDWKKFMDAVYDSLEELKTIEDEI